MSNQQEAAELRDNAKQEFISQYVAEHRHAITGDLKQIAELAMNADDAKYYRLFECMAELSYSGVSKSLQAAIDDIVDDHLEAQAEKEWEAGDD